MSQNNRLLLPVKRPQSSCWLFCHFMKGQQRKKKKEEKKEREKEEESLFWITAVWRPLTQMCRWFWPQWLPGACHSSLWWFSAGMSTAGTGFCSVAARTIDRVLKTHPLTDCNQSHFCCNIGFIRQIGPCLIDSDDICGPKWRLKCPRNFQLSPWILPRFFAHTRFFYTFVYEVRNVKKTLADPWKHLRIM